MLPCGGNYNGLGCGEDIDVAYELYDWFYVDEYDSNVVMHVACADMAALEI